MGQPYGLPSGTCRRLGRLRIRGKYTEKIPIPMPMPLPMPMFYAFLTFGDGLG
jgi:hypothetical protein